MYGYLQMDSDRVIVWQPIKTTKNMATQLIRKDIKRKANWMRMCNAADKLEFEDGRLLKNGWKIDDMDTNTISGKLTMLGIDHEIKDKYTVIIN